MGDALAPGADEGRGKQRYASGSRKQAEIRGCPNGETHCSKPAVSYAEYIGIARGTRGTETAKYPEEEKKLVIPLVVASERGRAQTSPLVGLGL